MLKLQKSLSYNYLTYKWQILSRRREYYFYLLNFYLSFVWLAIAYEVNNGTFITRHHPNPLSLTPILFLVFHVLYLLTYFGPRRFKKFIIDKPKLTYFTALSLLVAIWILVFVHHRELDSNRQASLVLVYILTNEIGISIFNQMGFANPVIMVLKLLSFLVLLIFLGFGVRTFLPSSFPHFSYHLCI